MTKEEIKLKIITMDGVFFSDSVSEIILPTDIGQIAVLPMHIPLISKIKEGEVVLRMGKDEKIIYNLSGSRIYFKNRKPIYAL
jgi:F-type H+-transporting ATPase subunit epsilon